MPCEERRATKLLDSGRARVHHLIPFVIRIIDLHVESCAFQPLELKLDPGSKVTGLAVVRLSEQVDSETGEVLKSVHILSLSEIMHRGRQISEALTARCSMRRRRRSNLRYREARFLNRGNKKPGWLAPSLQHRVDTTMAWVRRFQKWAPISSLAQELVRFDLQKMQAQSEGGDISGVEYQQGTLLGYEVRGYLLEKFHRTCMYCDATNVPMQIEHIHPKSDSGSNRISNLGLACGTCNTKKGSQYVRDFLAKDPARLKRVLAQVKAPLKDAAAVNSTRWALFNALKATGLPVSVGSGGQTQFNRTHLGVPKMHALDAACVGEVDHIAGLDKPTLSIKCTGRGSYQRTRLTKYGFPRGHLTREKSINGFQTGDMVKAVVTTGTKVGSYLGRVAIRASGNFNIQTSDGLVQGISSRYCTVVQRADGYGYQQVAKTDATGSPPKTGTLRVPRSASSA
jgi:5-methylcytosine-specific restriction endonuclease McrA